MRIPVTRLLSLHSRLGTLHTVVHRFGIDRWVWLESKAERNNRMDHLLIRFLSCAEQGTYQRRHYVYSSIPHRRHIEHWYTL